MLEAATQGEEDTLETLLNKVNVDEEIDTDGGTALMWAASEGHVRVVKHLISYDACVHHKDKNGRVAIMEAAGQGHEEVVKVLLAANANVNEKGSVRIGEGERNEMQPLDWAIQNVQVGVMKVLLAAGADATTIATLSKWTVRFEATKGNKTLHDMLMVNREEDHGGGPL